MFPSLADAARPPDESEAEPEPMFSDLVAGHRKHRPEWQAVVETVITQNPDLDEQP